VYVWSNVVALFDTNGFLKSLVKGNTLEVADILEKILIKNPYFDDQVTP